MKQECKRMNYVLGIIVFLTVVLISHGGCIKKNDENEAVKKEIHSTSAADAKKGDSVRSEPAPDNPQFFTAEARKPYSDVVKNMDSVLSPIFKKVFGEVKLVREGIPFGEHEKGGIESAQYIVQKMFDTMDAHALHDALGEARLKVSVPTDEISGSATRTSMSILRRSYSIAIIMDTAEQTIAVKSFRIQKSN